MPPEFVKVATVHEIPLQKGKVIEIEGREIALFKSNDWVYAMDNRCLHEGGPLAKGWIKEGIVTCPWHLWQFRVEDGALADEPAMRVQCFPVKVEGDDVFVDVSPITAPMRRNQGILQRMANGETAEHLGVEYHIHPEEIETIARQVRVGERLIWLGELYRRQGNIGSQDLLRMPYRDLSRVSYGAEESLEVLIELL